MENKGNVLIYETADGTTQLDVRLENETVWLSAEQMGLLFGRDSKTIRKHINNTLNEELHVEWLSQNLRQPLNMVLSLVKHRFMR